MTVPAFHVEAKLHAFRKTQDGVVVSFVVSPIDMPQALALDPLGTRYMLALCAIGDDEQPVPPAGAPSTPPQPNRKDTAAADSDGNARSPADATAPAGERKERRPWEAVPVDQRAGILCGDKAFWKFVDEKVGWSMIHNADDAAGWLRFQLGVESRKDLPTKPEAVRMLSEIRAEFMQWAGRVPVPVR